MSRIRVRYFGHVRELAGKREETITMDDDARLPDLVSEIANRHGEKFGNYVLEGRNRLREGFVCAVDGETIGKDEFEEYRCGQVKEFAILPPISGGT